MFTYLNTKGNAMLQESNFLKLKGSRFTLDDAVECSNYPDFRISVPGRFRADWADMKDKTGPAWEDGEFIVERNNELVYFKYIRLA